jgi:paraquat-inducible protein A
MTQPEMHVNAPAPRASAASRTQAVLIARPDLVVCNDCDAVHQRLELKPGTVSRCRRCNALLGRGHVMPVQSLLAFAFAALLLIVIGNIAPIVTLDLRGVISRATLPESIRYTWESGQPLVALLTAATAIVFPLCFTLVRLYVLLSIVRGLVPPGFNTAMRSLNFLNRWSMVEVFMMGTLVAVVRSAGLASVTPGIGLFAYAALTLLLTSILAAGTHSLWKIGSELGSTR